MCSRQGIAALRVKQPSIAFSESHFLGVSYLIRVLCLLDAIIVTGVSYLIRVVDANHLMLVASIANGLSYDVQTIRSFSSQSTDTYALVRGGYCAHAVSSKHQVAQHFNLPNVAADIRSDTILASFKSISRMIRMANPS